MSDITERLGQMLPDGNPVEKIEAIMNRIDAEQYIKALPGNVLYQLIKEAGWDQGSDLVPYATPEQVQNFLDFDAWRRDEFVPVRMTPWLAAIVEEARDEDFKKIVREIDSEMLAMLFKSQLQVYELDDGRIPDEAPDRAVMSPDGVYALVYPEEPVMAGLLRVTLERLFELDRVLAWTLLEAVRWELPSEMEEYALRWRTSRLEDFGFLSRQEALSVYSPLDPHRQREALEAAGEPVRMRAPGESLDLPRVVSSELDPEFLIVEVLSQIEDPERLRARFFELSSLLNKVMLADGIEPGELNSGRQVLRRALGYLSLGLEFVSRDRQDVMLERLERISLRDLFRTGHTLTTQLQRQAKQLENRPTLTLLEGLPHSLLGADDAALLEALSRLRPTYARDMYSYELFQHQHQLDDAALRLGTVAFKQLWVFGLQRLDVGSLIEIASASELLNDPIDVTFDTLFATWMARQLIDAPDGVKPLERDEVYRLLVALRERPWANQSTRETFALAFEELTPFLPGGTEFLLERWLGETLTRLEDELGRLRDASDATYAQQVILLMA